MPAEAFVSLTMPCFSCCCYAYFAAFAFLQDASFTIFFAIFAVFYFSSDAFRAARHDFCYVTPPYHGFLAAYLRLLLLLLLA